MRPSRLIRRFAPPSPRRGEEICRADSPFLKACKVGEASAPGFFSPPGRRWRAAPDEGASPNA